MAYSDRMVRAFALAHELHAQQRRKSTDAPYITHLMAVAALVGEHGGTEEMVIAALLHDAVEDQGGVATLARIRTEFGDDVAELVEAATDASTHPKPPWRARKEAHLARLATASPAARLVIAADKLHNARSLVATLKREGVSAWRHFKGGRDGTIWYYASMVDTLRHSWPHPILDELDGAIELLRQVALTPASAEAS